MDAIKRPDSPTWLTILALAGAALLFAAVGATAALVESASSTPPAADAGGAVQLENPTATATAAPGVVRIDVGSGGGGPGERTNVTVSLETAGFVVAATANDLHFDPFTFQLDPSACRSHAPDHLLVVTPLEEGAIHVLLQPADGSGPLTDGPLYTCTIEVLIGASRGTFLLSNPSPQAFDFSGAALANVVGEDGLLIVSYLAGICTGDCDTNRSVSVSELVTGVQIALDLRSDVACLPFDRNNDGWITVDELVEAVRRALGGCFSGPP